MSSAQKPTFIRPQELKSMLKTAPADLQIIDVRDRDFNGGHIKGCMNRPVDQFEDVDDVDQVIKEMAIMGKKKVVFHCMLSQVRGPMCAQRFLSRLPAVDTAGGAAPPEVFVLEGGFRGWARALESDPEMRELTADFTCYSYDN